MIQLIPLAMPLNSHPVVERLHGQMNVFGSLQLQHSQAPICKLGEQIHHIAVTTCESQDLPVNRIRSKIGVYCS